MGNGVSQSLPLAASDIQTENWESVDAQLRREQARTFGYAIYEDQNGTLCNQTGTILHHTCNHHPPDYIVRRLIEMYPGLLTSTSMPGGEVPLHFAICDRRRRYGTNRKPSEDVIRLLLDAAPQSVSYQSSPEKGYQSPLHLACAIRSPSNIIKMLYDADPEAARSLKDIQERTAWEVAKTHSSLLHPRWRTKVKSILKQSDEKKETTTEELRLNPQQQPSPPLLVNTSAVVLASAADKEETCVVCWDGPADHVLVPCGHMCLCQNCSSNYCFILKEGKCPVCRQGIHTSIKVFRVSVPRPDTSSSSSPSSPSSSPSAEAAEKVPAAAQSRKKKTFASFLRRSRP